MGSLYKFMDKDGIVKWAEISIAYNPNNPKLNKLSEIVESR